MRSKRIDAADWLDSIAEEEALRNRGENVRKRGI